MRYATRRALGGTVVACLLVAFAVTASDGMAPIPEGARVVLPGGPGEPNTVGSSDRVKAPEGPAHTATDVWFVRMMIPHHAQAVEMASLAAGRAHNPQIVALAERIKAAQQPEILQMRAWLAERGLAADETGHDHATMPGMQSPEAMRALAGARGQQFDRMFADMMSAHHQGAVDMAGLRLRADGDVMVERMANEIAFEQSVEIDRLRDIMGA